jgi:hypothetical protein
MIKFEKGIWQQDFISNKNPVAWRCGYCELGNLRLSQEVSAGNLYGAIKATCTYASCRKEYVLIGEIKPFAEGIEVSSQYYKIDDYRLLPTHFQPELSLFVIPKEVSEELRKKLTLSFNHFWYDLDACANKVRQALELIAKDSGGHGRDLHCQIQSLEGKLERELVNELTALKCIGNEGSHADEPFTRAQLLEMYRILVSVLNQLYPNDEEDKQRKKLVEDIKKNKGIKKL